MRVARASLRQLAREVRGAPRLAPFARPLGERGPGPLVARIEPHGLLQGRQGRLLVAGLPDHPRKVSVVGHVEGRRRHRLLHDPARLGETARPLVGRRQRARGHAPRRVDSERLPERRGLRLAVAAELLHVREIHPEPRHQREAIDRAAEHGACGIEAAHVGELAAQGGRGVPEVRPGRDRLLEHRQELRRLQRVARRLAEGEEAVAEDHLPHELVVDEGEGFAAFRGRGAGADELGDRDVVVRGDPDGRAPGFLRLGVPARGVERAGADEVRGGGGRLEAAGLLGLGGPLLGAAGLEEMGGELAPGPGVLGVEFHEPADRGLVRGGLVLAEPLDEGLVEAGVVGEAVEHGAQGGERGGAALGLRQEARHGGLRVGRHRIGLVGLLPEGEGLAEPALVGRQLRGGAKAEGGMAVTLGARDEILRAGEVAVARPRVGGVEDEVAVGGPERHRLVEHAEALLHLLQLLEGPEERARGGGGTGAEAAEAVAEEEEGGGGLAEMAGRDEVGLRVLLVLVLEAGGETVDLERLLAAAPVPEEPGEGVMAVRVAGRTSDGLVEEGHGFVMAAIVGRELAGVLGAEERGGLAALAEAAEDLETLLAAAEFAQVLEAGEEEIRVVREEPEKVVDAAALGDAVGVVGGHGAAALEGEPVAGGDGLERLPGPPRGRAVVPLEGGERRGEEVPEGGLGEVEVREAAGLRAGDEGHAARPRGAIPRERLLVEELAEGPLVGVADEEGAAERVVADHRLEVGVGGIDGGEGEGDASVEEGDGAVPGDGELAGDPAVLLGPAALALGGGPVVADLLRDGEVVGGHGPEAAEGGEGGGGAGDVMLAHEAHGEEDAARAGGGRGEASREGAVEGEVRARGPFGGAGEVAAGVGGVGAAGGEPLAAAFFQEGREFGEAVEAGAGVVVEGELGLERGELGHERAALEAGGGFAEEAEGVAVAVEQLKEVGAGLDGGAVPGLRGEGALEGLQRLGIAVLGLEEAGADDAGPAAVAGALLGAGHPVLSSVEVAEVGGDLGAEGGEVGAVGVGDAGEVAQGAEETPGGEGAAAVEHAVGGVVERLGVCAVGAPGKEVEGGGEPGGAQVGGHAARQDARARAGPSAERPERQAGLPGLEVQTLLVELADAAEIGRRYLHRCVVDGGMTSVYHRKRRGAGRCGVRPAGLRRRAGRG